MSIPWMEWREDAFGLVHGHWAYFANAVGKRVSLCSSITQTTFLVHGPSQHRYPTCLRCIVIAYELPDEEPLPKAVPTPDVRT